MQAQRSGGYRATPRIAQTALQLQLGRSDRIQSPHLQRDLGTGFDWQTKRVTVWLDGKNASRPQRDVQTPQRQSLAQRLVGSGL
jgi:hypothetical protein